MAPRGWWFTAAPCLPLDADQNGKPRSSIVIVPDDDENMVVPAKPGGRPDTATPLLIEVLRAALDTKGEYFTPDGKVPLQAVDSLHVREIFYRRYVDAEEDKKKSHGAQIKAFGRGLENAVSKKHCERSEGRPVGGRCSGSFGMRGYHYEGFVTKRHRFRHFKTTPCDETDDTP